MSEKVVDCPFCQRRMQWPPEFPMELAVEAAAWRRGRDGFTTFDGFTHHAKRLREPGIPERELGMLEDIRSDCAAVTRAVYHNLLGKLPGEPYTDTTPRGRMQSLFTRAFMRRHPDREGMGAFLLSEDEMDDSLRIYEDIFRYALQCMMEGPTEPPAAIAGLL